MSMARREALGEHADDVEVLVAREISVRMRARQHVEQRVFGPFARRDLGDDLLREDVERLRGDVDADRARRGARRRAAPCIRRARRATAGRAAPSARRRPCGSRVPRAAGTSRSTAASPIWQTSSTSPMSMPSSSEAVATSALSSPAFSRCSAARRRSFAMLPWCAITCAAPSSSDRWRVTRSAIRRVLTNTSVVRCSRDQVGEARVDLQPHLVRHHRFERRRRHLERQVARSHVAGVDDRAGRT